MESRRSAGAALTRRAITAAAPLALLACDGPQSALAPAGRGAERLAQLFWLMTGGAFVIWVAVIGLATYATYFARRPYRLTSVRKLVVYGGVVFPTLVLTALLVHGLRLIPPLLAAAPEGSLKVHVVGEQWWWRVRYVSPRHDPIEVANEIHLPLGRAVEFELETADVIHSFWIPSLGGKMDMIPGRKTRLVLEPTKPGFFRGACAEYCGASHAWMSFAVVVEQPQAFERWLARQASPAAAVDESTRPGRDVFLTNGCGACHSVRGTQAGGVVGPDLTHVGSRAWLGAGLLGNQTADFRRWIAETERLKPSVHMPAFGMLPGEELDALAHFLDRLE